MLLQCAQRQIVADHPPHPPVGRWSPHRAVRSGDLAGGIAAYSEMLASGEGWLLPSLAAVLHANRAAAHQVSTCSLFGRLWAQAPRQHSRCGWADAVGQEVPADSPRAGWARLGSLQPGRKWNACAAAARRLLAGASVDVAKALLLPCRG